MSSCIVWMDVFTWYNDPIVSLKSPYTESIVPSMAEVYIRFKCAVAESILPSTFMDSTISLTLASIIGGNVSNFSRSWFVKTTKSTRIAVVDTLLNRSKLMMMP